MYSRRPLAHAARRAPAAGPSDAIRSLDVSVLQEQLLPPVLGIGGRRAPTSASISSAAPAAPPSSSRWSTPGKAAVAFSLYPVSVADLMAISDAGAIMPPKSTWFEPKLRDGLLSPPHLNSVDRR